MAIVGFHGNYFFLSNHYESPVTYEGITYRNAEAAFQAQKTKDESLRIIFKYLPAAVAKNLGNRIELRSDWLDIRLNVMTEIVTAKFEQNKELADKLKTTVGEELINRNIVGDTYWGVTGTGGHNMLGSILEDIRKQLLTPLPDDSLEDNFLFSRLKDAWMEHDRLIIAYDLDDTVRPYKSKSCEKVKTLIKRAKALINPYFIVYTANPNLGKNIAFLESEELPYDSINENADFIGRYGEGIKLYYNLFFDDKAGIREPYFALEYLLDGIEDGTIRKGENNNDQV